MECRRLLQDSSSTVLKVAVPSVFHASGLRAQALSIALILLTALGFHGGALYTLAVTEDVPQSYRSR